MLVAFAGVLLAYALLRWAATAPPRQIVAALRWGAAVAGGAVGLWLIVTGRLGAALALGSMLAPMFVRWKALFRTIRNASGPTPGQTSQVETPSLRMTLDHDTGAMDGLVLKGPMAGSRLAELSPGQLLDLLRTCRVDDADAAQLLEAYLDRAHPSWREAAGGDGQGDTARPAGGGTMTRDEAYRVLGLAPGADADAVRAAHRRLMTKIHPDIGGSAYLAAKINEARDVLLQD